MLQPYSQAELALRDTLITKAETWAFDALAYLHGVNRPASFSRSTWRNVLLAAAYGYRGTWSNFWAVIREAYEPSGTSVVVSRNPAAPQTLTYVSGLGGGGFACDHANRLIKIDDKIYWSTGPQIGAGVSATLTLAEVGTSYWAGADWSSLSAPDQVTALVLPVLPVEPTPGPVLTASGDQVDTLTSGSGTGCLVRLLLSEGFSPPGTYLIDPAGAAKPGGQPFGGHMMDLFDPATPESGDQTDGPYPIYLVDGSSVDSLVRYFDPLLAAGVSLKPEIVDFCTDN